MLRARGFLGSQGQTSRDRGELVAGTDPARGEARLEDAPHGGDEAGSTREEDAVDPMSRDVGG